MGQTELVKLYSIQQKLMKFTELYYKDRQVIRKNDVERLHNILRTAEALFPDCIVLLHSDLSERIYVSSNVTQELNYEPKDVISFTDMEFIRRIHPEDVMPVRKAMEQVYQFTQKPGYVHEVIRYQINLRYNMNGTDYAHITYEAVTIQHEGYFADLAIIKNISVEKPFHYVELFVSKQKEKGFIRVQHYIPEQKGNAITPREKDIISLLGRGFSNEEIAETLDISVSTVKNHRSKLFRKLKVKNSLQLLNYARKHDLA
jgi:DNA-binding CsgD family transcriptional regulator